MKERSIPPATLSNAEGILNWSGPLYEYNHPIQEFLSLSPSVKKKKIQKISEGEGMETFNPLKSVGSFEYELSKERRNNSLLLVLLFALCS